MRFELVCQLFMQECEIAKQWSRYTLLFVFYA